MSKKIVIDLRIYGPQFGGLGRYNQKLLENLIKEDIVLLKRCLFFESIENHRKVYIQSIDTNCWLDVANKIITRDEYLNFEEKSNPFLETPQFDNLKLVA